MSLIKDYLLTQMNNELFDPGIDNLPMPVDGIEPDLEMLMQREQLMEDIDSIVDGFFIDTYEGQYPEERDELTRMLCDAVCKNFPAQ
jgi:hypothetical protein